MTSPGPFDPSMLRSMSGSQRTAVDSSTCCLITAPREHVLYNFRAQTVPPTPR